jgi:TPR repeat protein
MGPGLSQQGEEVLRIAARLTEAKRLYGEGLKLLGQGRYPQAGECISGAAEMGDSTAQCQLGYLYENGFFGAPNAGEAVRWYRKSADQCLPQGQFRLGACYQSGKGVEQDRDEAARLFDLAARRGHAEAAECLQMLRK